MRFPANHRAWLSLAAFLALAAGNLAPCYCVSHLAMLDTTGDHSCCSPLGQPETRLVDPCCCADSMTRGESRSYLPPVTATVYDNAAVVVETASVPSLSGVATPIAPERIIAGPPSDCCEQHPPRAPPARFS